MDKVYLVWKGEYSDKCVIAVFKTFREAEICASMRAEKLELCDVEEMEIGHVECVDDVQIGYWFFYDIANNDLSLHGYFARGNDGFVPNKVKQYGIYFAEVGVFATNEDEARKKASDIFAKYKAEKMDL